MNILKVLIFIILTITTVCISSAKNRYEVESFPENISKNCRNGVANIYDECSDQSTLLENALLKANLSNKSVLVVYGAESCIWCHVFDQYIKGSSRFFFYIWQDSSNEDSYWLMEEKQNPNAENEAIELNKYVSNNFVIAHIEGNYSPNGIEVIESTGFNTTKLKVLPTILILNNKGRFAGDMLPYNTIKGLEIRNDSGEEYRGYDRKILLNELKKLRVLALSNKQ